MIKSLKELSWNVTEEVYRGDKAISYSTMSTFYRLGHTCIPNLYDKKDGDALRFGSLVDCLLTEPETLKDRFFIATFDTIPESLISIAKDLFTNYGAKYSSIDKIPINAIIDSANNFSYCPTFVSSTRVRRVIEACTSYYKLLYLSKDKIVVSQEDLDKANSCIRELKNNSFTAKYFKTSTTEVEFLYQLKFKSSTLAEVPVRCMFDLLIVDHKNKVIVPIDLKTSGKNEHLFEESFLEWNYYLQATLYAQILKETIDKDEYFKDFKIAFYQFIVINRFIQAPLIWVFKDLFHKGDFISNNNITYKGWRSILKELIFHLKEKKYKYSYNAYHNSGKMIINNLKPIYENKELAKAGG